MGEGARMVAEVLVVWGASSMCGDVVRDTFGYGVGVVAAKCSGKLRGPVGMWMLPPVGGVWVKVHGGRYAVFDAFGECAGVNVVGNGILVQSGFPKCRAFPQYVVGCLG